jgi:outer membrane protein OmpA-like peptidoglycan-associated protein
MEMLRSAAQSGALSSDQRVAVVARAQADREVLLARQAEGTDDAAPQTSQQQPPKEMPKAEVEKKAQAIIADTRPASRLSDDELRKRLSDNRAVLATGQLSTAEERDLRAQLREDRDELRDRVASSQETPQERDTRTQTGTQADMTRNVADILEERTPSDRLTDRELEQRIRVLSRAVKAGNITVRQSEVARLLIEQDREELRQRLYADRDRRDEKWRQARARNEVFIDFHVGYLPPPMIFAAEAMPRDIEVQLIAPPLRQVSRAYTVQEIAVNQDIRETMPGIEIDTLNFDFGSAEVRPEEVDKLDNIAGVIERIVAARPDEVFLIEGHTDAVGTQTANDVLSQHRAQAVLQALIDYYAIDPENLRTVGLGERFLKIWTEEPEEENRRVTVRRITPLLVGGQG